MKFKTCQLPGCNDKHHAMGKCKLHYQRDWYGFKGGHANAWSQGERDKVAQYLRERKTSVQMVELFPGRTRSGICSLVGRDPVLKAIGLPGHTLIVRKPRKPRATKSNVVLFPVVKRAVNYEGVPVAQPVLRVVSNNTNLMVADYLKAHGARRFEQGESVDYFGLQAWLRDRGYTLTSRASLYTLSSGGRPKVMPWRNVVQFVDKMRLAEGLQPILRSA